MLEHKDSHPLSLYGFGKHLMSIATRDTAAFFGLKGAATVVGIFVCAIGGTWKIAPQFFSDNSPLIVVSTVFVVFTVFLLFGSYGLYVQNHKQLQSLHDELSEKNKPVASLAFVRRIMENFAHHGNAIAMSGDTAAYDPWIEASSAFVRKAFVAAWQDGFLWITPENSTVILVRNDKTREIKQTANMISTRATWLDACARELAESHLTYGRTEAELMEWIDWAPPEGSVAPKVPTVGPRGTPATANDVRRLMQHFGFVGMGLEGELAFKWRIAALEFVKLSLMPQFRVDFEMPYLSQHQSSYWLQMKAPHLSEVDISPDVTVEQLKQWENWQPAP